MVNHQHVLVFRAAESHNKGKIHFDVSGLFSLDMVFTLTYKASRPPVAHQQSRDQSSNTSKYLECFDA